MKPAVFIIEDDPSMAELLEDACSAAGFQAAAISTILDATQRLEQHLGQTQPAIPTLVIIDQQLVDKDHPNVEGWVLAFFLRHGQQNGSLHPCWIAATSSALDARGRRQRAEEAQCEFVVDKPYLVDHIPAMYAAVVSSPAPRHQLTPDIEALHLPALEMLMVLAQQPRSQRRVWSAQDIYFILGASSPAIHLYSPKKETAETLIHQLGGKSQAVRYIWDALPKLMPRHQGLLRRILLGDTKQEIYGNSDYSRKTLDKEIELICHLVAQELATSS